MVLMFMQWRDNIRKAFILQKYTNVCFCNMSFLSIYVCVSFNRCFVCCLGPVSYTHLTLPTIA